MSCSRPIRRPVMHCVRGTLIVMEQLALRGKKGEGLAEYVEMWQDKMRRLEALGEEFKLARCSQSAR